MALDFFDKEAIRQSLVNPNEPTPNAVFDLVVRLDAIQDAIDALTVGSASVDDVLTALQTTVEDY